MSIFVAVDAELYVRREDLPDPIEKQILRALEIPNVERQNMQKEKIGGWWRLPERIPLWRYEHGARELDTLVMPRGFMDILESGLKVYGHDIQWEDLRSRVDISTANMLTVPVRNYQDEAIKKILKMEQGVWESPPGSGKTVAILEAIRRLGQRSLVIVNSTNIAEQWRDRAKQYLGIDIGLLGDGTWEEKDFSIAIQQTLWSRRHELFIDGFFEQWGFVCLDECHHLPANTFTEVLANFTSYIRIGVSGTPYKQAELAPLVDATLGPLIHKTEKEFLQKKGWLIKPKVLIHNTPFDYGYIPTHEHNPKEDACCEYYDFGCQRDQKKKRHQNNYADLTSALISNDERNRLIANNISNDLLDGHTILVLSKRLAHLDDLKMLTGRLVPDYEDRLFMFTGKQNTDERMEIQAEAENGSCALFSTIADEALDIPRADRVHFVWPTRNTDIIRQQVGRIERPYNGKTDALVHDYQDLSSVTRGQLRDRVQMVYLPEKMEVKYVEE